MQHGSTLARLQQFTTLSVLVASIMWLLAFWEASLLVALLGAGAIAFSFTAVLALQFVLSWWIDQRLESPSMWEIAVAWLREVVQAARVFAWRQPFRWREVSDCLEPGTRGKRGIVFIHGFVCNRGFWTPWMKRLRLHGHAFIAVNLEPVFGSIDDYAPIVQAAVQRMTEATGMAPILVCHSMGGVVARRWLNLQESAAVHHVITIASPHHGTWLARFSASPNARQLGIRSEWLLQLQRDEAEHPRPPFTCWYTNCDNIVFPTSSACLPAANNRLLRGAGHVDLAFRPEVMQASLAIALGHEH